MKRAVVSGMRTRPVHRRHVRCTVDHVEPLSGASPGLIGDCSGAIGAPGRKRSGSGQGKGSAAVSVGPPVDADLYEKGNTSERLINKRRPRHRPPDTTRSRTATSPACSYVPR